MIMQILAKIQKPVSWHRVSLPPFRNIPPVYSPSHIQLNTTGETKMASNVDVIQPSSFKPDSSSFEENVHEYSRLQAEDSERSRAGA